MKIRVQKLYITHYRLKLYYLRNYKIEYYRRWLYAKER